MTHKPVPARLRREEAVLVVVDVQERLFAHMAEREPLEANVVRLARAAALLDVPVLATEQYPKGLGRTIPSVAGALPEGTPVIEKTVFSCPAEAAFLSRLERTGKRTLLLAGIEAHVCVLQTALDLLERGYDVHVIEDAVSSRSRENKLAGVARLARSGAVQSTTEMAIFEMLRGADHPRFKEIQGLVR